jgi:hypothetical protein
MNYIEITQEEWNEVTSDKTELIIGMERWHEVETYEGPEPFLHRIFESSQGQCVMALIELDEEMNPVPNEEMDRKLFFTELMWVKTDENGKPIS